MMGFARTPRITYPKNYSTQLFQVNNQIKAYGQLDSFEWPKDIPTDVLRTIARKAYREYRTNYSTQLFMINNEIKAYRRLHGK
ncbi:MAG: hypothetical protein AAFX06_28700 [Planctomycetota bacterium]